MARFRPDRDELPGLSPERQAHQDALSADEIERLAAADPDHPAMTEAELARGVAARRIRHIRESTGLSQREFAERYRINLRRLQGLEQGRFMPDSAFLAYLRVIERDHAAVERALAAT